MTLAVPLLLLASAAAVAESDLTFTEQLREEAGASWTAIVAHPFTDELASGSIAPEVLKRYLIQDHRFVDGCVVLVASIIAAAPSLKDRLPAAQFLGAITQEGGLTKENTYFERSFDALGVTMEEREDTPNAPVQAAFDTLMRSAASSGSLATMLSVMVVAEWSYQSWGERVLPGSVEEPFYCREWIDLHSGEFFGKFVGYLRDLLDKIAPSLSEAERAAARAAFACAVSLEKAFFDQAYSAEPLPAPKCIEPTPSPWWRRAFGRLAGKRSSDK